MKRIALLLVVLLPSAALAQSPGINLAWNDCGSAGQNLATFACNSNTGAHQLYVSFVPPAGIDSLDAVEATLTVLTFSATPSWWSLGTGGCRSGLAATFNFLAGPFTCVDPWQGQAAGGFQYDYQYTGTPNSSRLRVVCAVPPTSALAVSPSSEYYAMRITLPHTRSTGTGACTGCATPAGIVLRQLTLDQNFGGANFTLTQSPSGGNVWVSWQCPGAPDYDHGTPYAWFADCGLPTHAPTWGAIKSLYR